MRCFDAVWERLGALRTAGEPLPEPVRRPPSSRENGNGAADAAATADAASDSGEAGAAEQPEAEQVQRG